MGFNFRRRSAPVSTLRAKLQQRLDEKGGTIYDDDFIPSDETVTGKPFFLFSTLKMMHRYFLPKLTAAIVLILLTAVLIKGGYSWGTPLLQALGFVVKWDLEPAVLTEKVEPAFRLLFDRLEIPAAKLKAPVISDWGGVPLAGTLRSGYGLRSDSESGREEMHYGIDLAARKGAVVRALREGRVEQVISGDDSPATVVVVCEPGWSMIYRGLAAVSVGEGETIEKGTRLGKLGAARRYEQPHLHFELRFNGRPVPPPAGWVAGFTVVAERI